LQVFLAGDRYTDRHGNYRPRIECLEMSCFAGFFSYPLVFAVGAVDIPASFTDGL